MVEVVGKHYMLVGGGSRSGGLSTVRKGVDDRDGSAVAVKFIVGGTDELSQKVFDREIRALRIYEGASDVQRVVIARSVLG